MKIELFYKPHVIVSVVHIHMKIYISKMRSLRTADGWQTMYRYENEKFASKFSFRFLIHQQSIGICYNSLSLLCFVTFPFNDRRRAIILNVMYKHIKKEWRIIHRVTNGMLAECGRNGCCLQNSNKTLFKSTVIL